MNKEYIISEIKRTASENNNQPLGKSRFEKNTGIKESDWYGIYWVKWSDALKEAGFEPNKLQAAYSDSYLIEKYIELIREKNRFPSSGELRYKSTNDKSFPSHNTFCKLGNIQQRAKRIIEYCNVTNTNRDIIVLCNPVASKEENCEKEPSDIEKNDENFGYVYMLKSGKYYKIGKTFSPGRRYYELKIQLPDKIEQIHEIRTDDPSGIEEYWHKRFAEKRKNGEWFELSRQDIKAFKRRHFM